MVVRVPNVKSLSFFKSLSFWVFLKKNLPPFFENQIVEFLDDTGRATHGTGNGGDMGDRTECQGQHGRGMVRFDQCTQIAVHGGVA